MYKYYILLNRIVEQIFIFQFSLKARQTEEFVLPKIITDITGQTTVSFGDAVVSTSDTTFGTELCEEMFTSDSPSIRQGLDGVEIFTNSSGSYHQLRKLQKKIDLIRNATKKVRI
jgi:NAD+ synthase (glutamine-hydrolysing)